MFTSMLGNRGSAGLVIPVVGLTSPELSAPFLGSGWSSPFLLIGLLFGLALGVWGVWQLFRSTSSPDRLSVGNGPSVRSVYTPAPPPENPGGHGISGSASPGSTGESLDRLSLTERARTVLSDMNVHTVQDLRELAQSDRIDRLMGNVDIGHQTFRDILDVLRRLENEPIPPPER